MEQPEVVAACKQSGVNVKEPIEADEVFIASHYLKYLAGPQNESGHVQNPDLSSVVRYAFKKGLTALETDLDFSSFGSEFKRGQIHRISVKPAMSPECRAFRYPWWELPALRRLGLSPDHCVAVERLDAPTARVRLLAQPTKVFQIVTADREWFALWRIDVEAGTLDEAGRLQPVIRVTDHVARFEGGGKGYSGWAWGCADRDVRAAALNGAFRGKGNRLLHAPEQVVVPPPEVEVQESSPTKSEFAQLRWLERERCAGGANTYDAAGTVWIQDISINRDLRTALHVLRDGRLLVAPMPVQFPRGVYSNHSALHFKGGFAVNLTRSFNNDEFRRLVVFDENLVHIATWRLSVEQMEELTPPEPATINRCTDVYNDQFQREPHGATALR